MKAANGTLVLYATQDSDFQTIQIFYQALHITVFIGVILLNLTIQEKG